MPMTAHQSEHANQPSVSVSGRLDPISLGAIVIVSECSSSARTSALLDASEPSNDVATIYIPRLHPDARAGDAYLAFGDRLESVLTAEGCIILRAPSRMLTSVLPTARPPITLTGSTAVVILYRYLRALLSLGRENLSERQATIAADAILALTAATFGSEVPRTGLGARRSTALLDRAIDYIDANLCSPLCVETMLSVLGCSRSALYRATAGTGGVVGIMAQRRLARVHALLADPQESRTIADIAADHGFSDATSFSRRFKAFYGVPPGVVRRSGNESGSVEPDAVF